MAQLQEVAASLETSWKGRHGTTAAAAGQPLSKEKTMNLSSIRARRALRSLVIHVTLAATAGVAEALTIWVLNR
ncbi:hypothetical protein [Streptomyces xanthochromogenes]|uniref:hypothetical protein n=1 Tax=Streptomyces xanthochromogenes TaxID=67384 RepID=UPI003805A134